MTEEINTFQLARTKTLNMDGLVFQNLTRESLIDKYVLIHEEFPVSFPPPKPGQMSRESKLDLWMRNPKESNPEINFLIECKKADPKLKEWIFFPSYQQEIVVVSKVFAENF